jgi:hypothetical protein
METTSGSDLNKIIGIGTRIDRESGDSLPVTNFYDSMENNVVWDFSQYNVAKYFGININDAMNLPLDRWYKIRNMAKMLSANKPDDIETMMFKLFKDLLSKRGGDT